MSELPPPVFAPFVKVLDDLPTWSKARDVFFSRIFSAKIKTIPNEEKPASK